MSTKEKVDRRSMAKALNPIALLALFSVVACLGWSLSCRSPACRPFAQLVQMGTPDQQARDHIAVCFGHGFGGQYVVVRVDETIRFRGRLQSDEVTHFTGQCVDLPAEEGAVLHVLVDDECFAAEIDRRFGFADISMERRGLVLTSTSQVPVYD